MEPGEYYISKWGVPSGWPCHELRHPQDITDHIRNNRFRLEAGRAYYLGDYSVSQCSSKEILTTVVTMHYVLEAPVLNFEETTREYESKYPALANLPKSEIFTDTVFKKAFNKRHMIVVKTHYYFY